ncbi:hypothetical protein EHO57_13895 [Leptospira langatensis]|uniref:Uncharacterized protein n=1 Tax=Leptospira langatensis TaxID=2484983 RepID=A0A5R2ASR5_9LEPT|nr:hypothetical protein [Leptospira langatensis]TGJ99848.1 hypothetical protein EHO57_13895 [Leptospira langatensis]
MFDFTDSINRLKNKIKERAVSKSDLGTGAQNPDITALASEVTTLLDDNTVKPEVPAVKDWAVSKGLSEEQAGTFATEVVNSYFDSEGKPVQKSNAGSPENGEPGTGTDEERQKREEDEKVEKSRMLLLLNQIPESLQVLKSSVEVLAASTEYVIDQLDKTGHLAEEVAKLKSELSKIANIPAGKRDPVTQALPGKTVTKTEGIVAPGERNKYGDLILKGIEMGKCQVEDMNYFETTYKLAPRVQAFIENNKEVLK